MNEKLIEKLRNGEIACINDGSVEDLNKVLNHTFPKDCPSTGKQKFYYTQSSEYWRGDTSNNGLPSCSVKDFLTEEFPERWYVVYRNEYEFKECVKWCNSQRRYSRVKMSYDMYDWYIIINRVCIDNNACFFTLKDVKQKECVEITFEQFKQHILMEKKEIIGYKVKSEYIEFANKLVNATSMGKNKLFFDLKRDWYNKFKKAGVLNLWFEPVYEEEKTLPKINGYESKYEHGVVTYGCAKFNQYWFEEILKLHNSVLKFEGVGTRHLKSIKLDSGVEITMEQVKQIVEYINSKL